MTKLYYRDESNERLKAKDRNLIGHNKLNDLQLNYLHFQVS